MSSAARSGPASNSSPDGESSRVVVDERAEAPEQLDEVGLVAIVDVLLPVPGSRPDADRVGDQIGVLEKDVEHVEPEAVDAALQPLPHHGELGGLDRPVPPVEVGLLRQERVEVELVAFRLPGPGRAAEERDPVVRRQRAAIGVEVGRIAPDVPVRERPLPRLATRLEPGMLVARVVHHEVEDDPHPALVRLGDEPFEVGLRAEDRIDRGVVADVVTDVEAGRRVDRRQPDRVDPETVRPQVVEPIDDPRAGPRPHRRRCRQSCAGRPGRRRPSRHQSGPMPSTAASVFRSSPGSITAPRECPCGPT